MAARRRLGACLLAVLAVVGAGCGVRPDEQPRTIRLALDFDADFVDVFEVRGFARHRRGKVRRSVVAPDRARLAYASLDGVPRSTEIHFWPKPLELTTARAVFELELAPKQRRAISVTVTMAFGSGSPAVSTQTPRQVTESVESCRSTRAPGATVAQVMQCPGLIAATLTSSYGAASSTENENAPVSSVV